MSSVKTRLVSSRTAVFELEEKECCYYTEAYEVFVNGELVKQSDQVICSLNHLLPDQEYHVSFRRKETEFAHAFIHTEKELVTLNVRAFGAVGDGIHDDTAAIQAAILCCPEHARVYLPEGTYAVTGIFLKSHLILELEEGAVLAGIFDRSRIPVLPGMIEQEDEDGYYNLGTWEGNPLDMFVSLITGISVEDVLICGKGVLDGRADFSNWWNNVREKDVAWRPRMVFLNHCSNITIQGVTVQNSPSWNLHPYFSKKISFLDMKVLGPQNSHNTDGCDPESCEEVEILGVYFSVGDDCIAVKSGKIYMGKTKKTPSSRISIRQCCMEKGHGAITLGSEIAAGVEHFVVSNCLFRNTDRGLRIKTRRGRGKDSVLNGIVFENIQMEQVRAPFVVNSFYFCDPDGHSDYVASKEALPVDERTPEIGVLEFKNITCRNAHYCAAYIYGLPEQKIRKIVFDHVHVTYAVDAEEGTAAMMLGCEPGKKQGIFLGNVETVELKDVHLEGVCGVPVVQTGVDHLKEKQCSYVPEECSTSPVSP